MRHIFLRLLGRMEKPSKQFCVAAARCLSRHPAPKPSLHNNLHCHLGTSSMCYLSVLWRLASDGHQSSASCSVVFTCALAVVFKHYSSASHLDNAAGSVSDVVRRWSTHELPCSSQPSLVSCCDLRGKRHSTVSGDGS